MRRTVIVGVLLFGVAVSPLRGDDKAESAKLDKKIYDALRELHNSGADIFNANDYEGAYRYFQATVKFAREMLTHRPALQKTIDEGLQQAERQPTIVKKTFAMHLLVEKVRDQLRGEEPPLQKQKETSGFKRMEVGPKKMDNGPEKINSFPRELPPETKIDGPFLPPPPKKQDPLMSLSNGVGGRLLYKGKYLPGVSVVFVTRDQPRLLTHETVSDEDGYYRLEEVTPGKYTVLLEPTRRSPVRSLPERYSLVSTSSFVLEVSGGAEVADIVLQ